MSEKTGNEVLAGCAAAFFMWVVVVPLNGWVLTKLWAWFVVTGFDAKPIGITTAMGLALLFNFTTTNRKFTQRLRDDDEDTVDLVGGMFLFGIVMPFIVLFYGYVIKTVGGA